MFYKLYVEQYIIEHGYSSASQDIPFDYILHYVKRLNYEYFFILKTLFKDHGPLYLIIYFNTPAETSN